MKAATLDPTEHRILEREKLLSSLSNVATTTMHRQGKIRYDITESTYTNKLFK